MHVEWLEQRARLDGAGAESEMVGAAEEPGDAGAFPGLVGGESEVSSGYGFAGRQRTNAS